MTAHAMSGDREKSLDAGMNDHVNKPIDPDTFYRCLFKWLAAKQENPPDFSGFHHREDWVTAPDLLRIKERLPQIDVDAGIKMMAGNQDLYRHLLKMFTRDYSDSIEKIRTAVSAEEIKTAMRIAHTVKGLAGSIGSGELHNIFRQIETALAEGKEGPESLMDEAGILLNRIIATVDSELPEKRGDDKEAERLTKVDLTTTILPKLEKLLSLLAVNDMEFETVFRSLQSGLSAVYSNETQQLADAVDRHHSMSDRPQAV